MSKYIRIPGQGCSGCCFDDGSGGCSRPGIVRRELGSCTTDGSYQYQLVTYKIPDKPLAFKSEKKFTF